MILAVFMSGRATKFPFEEMFFNASLSWLIRAKIYNTTFITGANFAYISHFNYPFDECKD